MRKLGFLKAGFLGALVGGAAAGVSYLGRLLVGLPFIPFDVFDWLARVLPGRFLAASIDAMVAVIRRLHLGPTAATAKLAEQGLAVAEFVLAWIVFGLVLGVVSRRRPKTALFLGHLGGALGFVFVLGVEIARGLKSTGVPAAMIWLAGLLWGAGALLGRMVVSAAPAPAETPDARMSRRRFLYLSGLGSFAAIVAAAGASLFGRKRQAAASAAGRTEDQLLASSSGPAASPPVGILEKRFPPVPGTRSEVTETPQFYRIDINLVPPAVDGETWRLRLEGLVERPLTLSLQDIRAMPRQIQAITLSCISNPVGGDLISTAFLTGVPFKLILDRAGLKPEVRAISIESADGFYESVPLGEARDDRTMLVYEMNGEPLTRGHGFPLRIYIPGHYGMKQPKWIRRLEAIDHAGAGYWVERGWSPTASVMTTSVIDAAAADGSAPAPGSILVGGIAYSGDRGISRVEVRVDDGPWDAAELRVPPVSPLTWVQWRWLGRAARGEHTFRVRAYDGAGKLQVIEDHGTFPDGATGIFKKSAFIG